jgi:hypothetical protein
LSHIYIDCDICENCFLIKKRRELGDFDPDWRDICPPGHQHVKAHVEGWWGIKSGTIRLTASEVKVKGWLTRLENQWIACWEGFWSDSGPPCAVSSLHLASVSGVRACTTKIEHALGV